MLDYREELEGIPYENKGLRSQRWRQDPFGKLNSPTVILSGGRPFASERSRAVEGSRVQTASALRLQGILKAHAASSECLFAAVVT